MAIDYRNVDAADVQEQVLLNRAMEAERNAFAAEMEVVRLDAVAPTLKNKNDREALEPARRTAKENAEALRNAASRADAASLLTDEHRQSVHADFLNSWVTSLESEHVGHTALIAQERASLADTSATGPTEDERAAIQQRLDNSVEALSIIESSWHVATKSLDSVVPREPAPAVVPVAEPALEPDPEPSPEA